MQRGLALVLLALLAGCGDTPQPRSSGACAAGLRWHGRDYVGVAVQKIPPIAPTEIRVHMPGCNDSNGPHDDGHDVTLHAVDGVPVSVALAGSGSLYVTQDSVPALRGHPLHAYFFPPQAKRLPRTCRPRTVTGTMGPVTLGDVFAVGDTRLRFTADTVLRSPAVDGVPRIHKGDRVTAEFLDCPHRRIDIAVTLRVGSQ